MKNIPIPRRGFRFIAFLFVALSTQLFLLASCDKIESDQHWVYSGVSAEWHDYTGVVPNDMRVLMEKYTGVRCVNCPKADTVIHEAADKYGDAFIVIATHAGTFSRPYGEDPTLSCSVAEEWHDYFGITAEPMGLLMRGKNSSGDWDLFSPIANFDNLVEDYLNRAPEVAIALSRMDSGGYSYASVEIEFLEDIAVPLTLTLVATEDDVQVTQESPAGHIEDYPENHVLRCAITDPWGMEVVADGKRGTKRQVRLPLEISNVTNLNNCNIVAFISEKDSRRILNAAQN